MRCINMIWGLSFMNFMSKTTFNPMLKYSQPMDIISGGVIEIIKLYKGLNHVCICTEKGTHWAFFTTLGELPKLTFGELLNPGWLSFARWSLWNKLTRNLVIYAKDSMGFWWYGSWWRHQMETFSVLLALCAGKWPVPGEFPAQRPVTRCFDNFLDMSLNKRLRKQSWGWWFETQTHPLWCHCKMSMWCSPVLLCSPLGKTHRFLGRGY